MKYSKLNKNVYTFNSVLKIFSNKISGLKKTEWKVIAAELYIIPKNQPIIHLTMGKFYGMQIIPQ